MYKRKITSAPIKITTNVASTILLAGDKSVVYKDVHSFEPEIREPKAVRKATDEFKQNKTGLIRYFKGNNLNNLHLALRSYRCELKLK